MTEMFEVLLKLDTELFIWLNNLGSPKWDQFWLFVTNKKSWISLYLVLLLLIIFKLKDWRKIGVFVLVTATMVTFIDQTTSSFFKPVFGRLRPCHYEDLDGLFRLVKSYCGGKYSFFSGHSSNSFAVAVYLGMIMKPKLNWMLPVLLIWAAMVAYSRIYVGVHFPLDIVLGGIWGAFFGYLFYRLYQFIAKKYWS